MVTQDKKRKTEFINFRLTPEEYSRLESVAARYGMSSRNFAREWLRVILGVRTKDTETIVSAYKKVLSEKEKEVSELKSIQGHIESTAAGQGKLFDVSIAEVLDFRDIENTKKANPK